MLAPFHFGCEKPAGDVEDDWEQLPGPITVHCGPKRLYEDYILLAFLHVWYIDLARGFFIYREPMSEKKALDHDVCQWGDIETLPV